MGAVASPASQRLGPEWCRSRVGGLERHRSHAGRSRGRGEGWLDRLLQVKLLGPDEEGVELLVGRAGLAVEEAVACDWRTTWRRVVSGSSGCPLASREGTASRE